MLHVRDEYNFSNLDRWFGRNNVTLDDVDFRAGIRQNFLKKIRISRVCVALKTIWSYCTLININCT